MKNLTEEQYQLIDLYFKELESGKDGEATVYHIEDVEQLQELKAEISEPSNPSDHLVKLQPVLDALERNIRPIKIQGKTYWEGFDFVLQK